MIVHCPYCSSSDHLSDIRPNVKKAGHFRRKSDSRRIQRFRCLRCFKYFSLATFHPCFRQKKRQFNDRVKKLLCSCVSLRRISKNLHLSRTTVKRKLIYLGQQAELELKELNDKCSKAEIVEFDDLETFEHTKFKPLSVPLAVESKTRRILGFEVCSMPAKGNLSKIALKKYGRRVDHRSIGRQNLFEKIRPLVIEAATFKSDQNPHYPKDLKDYFPHAIHEAFPGQRGSIVGQGELKKIRFDPLFSLNHTCAMLRANVNRLVRRTWCTTKLPKMLAYHLAIYAVYHNKFLINSS
jgi:transposase-like protein